MTRSSCKINIITGILVILLLVIPSTVGAHDATANLQNEETLLKSLYDKNKQAVVMIRVAIDPAKIKTGENRQENKNKEQFKKFIFPILKEKLVVDESGQTQSFQIGTGFIITPDGEILTNYHVIDAYKEIYVFLANGPVFKADVLGFDKASDIALLKIQTAIQITFPTLTMGDSNSLTEAKPIFVIGHPFALSWTRSSGTVNEPRRLIPVNTQPLIQIQAPINPGNSGSPLITTLDNKVVGIIQSIPDDANGGSTGIAFAIPINFAKTILPFLRNQKNKKNNAEK